MMAAEIPGDNVFVGDLPQDITTETLTAVFAAYGTVQQARVNAPKHPGQKASGLVRFGSVEEATWVVQNLNGNLAQGLSEPIVVRFASSQGGKGGPPPGNYAPGVLPPPVPAVPAAAPRPQGGPPAQPNDNVFVGDLPGAITNEQVTQIFSNYGTVVQSRTMQPKMPGGKSSALVRFGSVEEATWVVTNLNGNLAEGLQEPVVVRFAHSNSPGAGAGPPGGGHAQYQQQTSYPQAGMAQSGYGHQPQQHQNRDAPPSDNVFIGNLPQDVSSDQVKMIFSAYGTVVQCRANAPKGPGGKASALVRFATVEEATWVVTNLNGNLAEGLQEPVVARFASTPNNAGGPPAAAQGWGGGYNAAPTYGQGKGAHRAAPYGQGPPMGKASHSKEGVPEGIRSYVTTLRRSGVLGEARVTEDRQIYVNKLPSDTTDADLYRIFSPFGALSSAKAMLHPEGNCKGFGFVDFLDATHAEAAIKAISGFVMPDGTSIMPSLKVSKKNDAAALPDAAVGYQQTAWA